MNNSQKFYEISKEMLGLLQEPVVKHNDNFEHEKRKFQSKIKDWSEEKMIENIFTFQFLIDVAYLGLNKEKVEEKVVFKWDDYKPELLQSYPLLQNNLPSKVPYFKQWLRVVDCKEKYKTENANFWILKLRNSLLHCNFEFQYDTQQKHVIKIKEGSETKTDVLMKVVVPGFHEFMNDNFYNLRHDDFGLSVDWVNVVYCDIPQVKNRQELEDYLKNKLYIGVRKNKEGCFYDGENFIDSETGEKLGRQEKSKAAKLRDSGVFLESHDYVDSEMKLFGLSDYSIEMLVSVLEKDYNIYKASKQKNILGKVIRNYLYPIQSVNRILHEIDSYLGGMITDKKDYRSVNLDIKKMMAVFHEEETNINNAFIVLKLYNFLYRVQNKNSEALDYANIDFAQYCIVETKDEMEERIKKYCSYSEKEAINMAYVETIRNALAHGNIEIKYIPGDDKVFPCFEFNDIWTNRKTGIQEKVSLITPARLLEKTLDQLDVKLYDFAVETMDVDLNSKEREQK